MTILPPQAFADLIGIGADGITVMDEKVLWARRDRYAYCIEALIEIEIAYRTDEGLVVQRNKALVNTEVSRIGGTRARLIRAAALLTAGLRIPAKTECRPVPLAA